MRNISNTPDIDVLHDLLGGRFVDFANDFDFDQIVECLQSFGIEVRPLYQFREIYPELQCDDWRNPYAKKHKTDSLTDQFHAYNAAGQWLFVCKYLRFNTWSLNPDEEELHDEEQVNAQIRKFILHHIYTLV